MQDEIREIVLLVLREIQEKSGRQMPEEIHDGTCPIGDFEGFSSLNVVEAITVLMDYFDYPFPLDLLLGTSPDSPVTLGEMVNRIFDYISAQGGLP